VTGSLLLIGGTSSALADIRVGGFNVSRGGGMSIQSGDYLSGLRTGLAGLGIGPLVYSSTDSLSSTYLGSVDVFVVSSVRDTSTPIQALSEYEMLVLLDFVQHGGGLIVIADNTDFGGHSVASANGSLLDSFGLGITGHLFGVGTPTLVHPVTSGVASFQILDGGFFDILPASCQVLARIGTGDPVLVTIPHNAMGSGSGAVVAVSDASFVFNESVNAEAIRLIGNAITYAAPLPSSTCYANCDGSTASPVLTANDFFCFLYKFSQGDGYTNCDGSTVAPVLTANDFQCFLNAFAQGCP